MRQRVMIAMALALEPEVLIADEPTTALDVTIQAQILRLLDKLNRERDLAVVLITHDLGVVAEIADRVVVMYAGQIVEDATLDEIFYDPQHPYTWGLLGSLARLDQPRPERLPQIAGPAAVAAEPADGLPLRAALPVRVRQVHAATGSGGPPRRRRPPRPLLARRRRRRLAEPMKGDPLLEVTDLVKHFPIKSGIVVDREVARVRAVDGVSFTLHEGETLGLVGESGCGKSTLCRAILQLVAPTSGSVRFDGQELVGRSRRDLRPLRREMQMIFQDPFASLNPRKRVGQIVGDPLELHGLASGAELKRRVQELLDRVGLQAEHYNRYPARVLRRAAPAHRHRPGAGAAAQAHHRRRAGVGARRLGAGADHQPARGPAGRVRPVLPVRRPRPRCGPPCLGPGRGDVPRQDRRELRRRRRSTTSRCTPTPMRCCRRCRSPTRASNVARERIMLEGDVPSPIDPPPGCRFHTRCVSATDVCRTEEPALIAHDDRHVVACHHPRTG